MEDNEFTEITLIEPYNPLDPVVVIDPTLPKPVLVTLINDKSPDTNPEKYEGSQIPVIRVNNKMIKSEDIELIEINHNGFLPSITVEINDSKGDIKYSDAPGLSNSISVVMTTAETGTYKKISLDFYITDCHLVDGIAKYTGIFKCPCLEKKDYKQLGTDKLSTFEMLKLIAGENGLGFAATPNCEEISDKYYRLMHSEKLKDFITNQISYGGDEENVFDTWVDLYGYIILVNLKHVFSEKIDTRQLVIYQQENLHSVDSRIGMDDVKLVPRVLNNSSRNTAITNMCFKEYDNIISNGHIMKNGGLVNYYILSDFCKTNKIDLKQIQTIENSIDGITDSTEYEYENVEFLGIENTDYCSLYQKQVHDRLLNKLRSKQLCLTMKTANLGLQRGTLVCVTLFDSDMGHKASLINNGDNALQGTVTADLDADDNWKSERTADNKEEIASEQEEIINTALSGVYYIDAVMYSYNKEEEKINQYLYLIKRDASNNLINKNTAVKIIPKQ